VIAENKHIPHAFESTLYPTEGPGANPSAIRRELFASPSAAPGPDPSWSSRCVAVPWLAARDLDRARGGEQGPKGGPGPPRPLSQAQPSLARLPTKRPPWSCCGLGGRPRRRRACARPSTATRPPPSPTSSSARSPPSRTAERKRCA
jgi:hypothetical protein